MKSASHLKSFLLLLLGLVLVPGSAVRGQEAPPAPPAPAQPAAPAETKPADEEKRNADAAAAREEQEAPPAVAPAQGSDEAKPEDQGPRHRRGHRTGNERVSFGSNSTLPAGESAQAVVSILGSSTSAGDVAEGVVSVLGSSRVEGGTVGDAVVSVLGNSYVNGEVRGQVVAVLGNVELGPKAVVGGEIVCIGGQVTRADGAVIKGNIQNIGIAGRHFNFSPLTTWFTECVLYARLLAYDRSLGWAWVIAFIFLAFYALVAVVAPAGVNKCVETLEERPGSSLLAALLTLMLTPVAFILLGLLCFIAVGFVLIPAFSLGLFFASLFGRVVMLAWLGRRFTKLLGDGPAARPVLGVLIGGIIIMFSYSIPIVGFITYKLLGILGLGVVVYTLIRQFKASRPPKPAPVMPPPAAAPEATAAPLAGDVPPPISPVALSAAPPVVSAATLPRAGFWIRLCAAFLDFVLVFVSLAILFNGILNFHGGPGSIFLLWIAYHPLMWKTKGTTIGGIICGLKLVRLDDRPIDWGVAIVRCLTAFMSMFLAGLGFLWVAFDDERQSWHDKVAGTTLVKVPKGTPLL
jgi:uncharacterized RDD family membrane protein YckC